MKTEQRKTTSGKVLRNRNSKVYRDLVRHLNKLSSLRRLSEELGGLSDEGQKEYNNPSKGSS